MPERDLFRIANTDGQMKLQGVIDEHADLSFLASLAGPKVVLNLRGIRRINSYGVRHWLENIRKVPAQVQLEFVEVPPPIVDQVNMVHGFMGRGHILSFYVPYSCEKCEDYHEKLIHTADCRGKTLPPVQCPSCGSTMDIDDVEEQYLQILKDA